MSQSVQEHRASAPDSVGCVVVTVSDSRTVETDRSGALMQELLGAAGHEIVGYRIVRDEPTEIERVLADATEIPTCDVILFNGGTGIAQRDTTFDVISRSLEKTLPGFGELFRMLSFEQIGAAAMLSRATAGVYRDRLVVSTPGSSNAVRLAMERLIVPELAHLVFEIRK
jgi:molybdenum cofactor biosynthesis protein B